MQARVGVKYTPKVFNCKYKYLISEVYLIALQGILTKITCWYVTLYLVDTPFFSSLLYSFFLFFYFFLIYCI